jgi:Lrp/AsnC family transcriptional regulator, leucine-responsive regulatory protein
VNKLDYATIDRGIVAILKDNGRATHQTIARKLGVSATVVASRIRKMEQDQRLKVVAVCDLSVSGSRFLVRIEIATRGAPAADVAEALSAFPEVIATHLVVGRHDIAVLAAFRDFDHMAHLLYDRFGQVAGIRSMVTSIVTDVVKCRLM